MLKSEALQALVNLQGNKDFEIFSTWLKETYSENAHRFIVNRTDSDSQHRISQGQVAILMLLVGMIENARKELQAIKEKKEG